MAASTGTIEYRPEDGVGWITINNPAKRNSISFDMWSSIPGIFRSIEADAAIRVVVIAGAGGKAFASGADISEFEEKRSTLEAIAEYDRRSGAARKAISDLSKPIIAMIEGHCMGGGLGLALQCDFRIAAVDARFGIPAARLGVGYAFNNVKLLADTVGMPNAMDILVTARQFGAEEAYRMALLHRVAAPEDLIAHTKDFAENLGKNAPLSMKASKLAIKAAMESGDGRDLAAVSAAIEACATSADYKEGYRAFLEKRAAVFTGR